MDRERKSRYTGWLQKGIMAECVLVTALAALVMGSRGENRESRIESSFSNHTLAVENDYIKWVDFTVSYEALCKAYDWDVGTYNSRYHVDWIELLSYTAAKTGGEFDKSALKTMDKAAEKLAEGETTIEELTEDLKYYSYYLESYDAAIGGLVGEYWEETSVSRGTAGTGADKSQGNNDTETAGNYVKKYGLKGYFPLARGFDYTHYDDFGVGRSYGYQRKHLG